MYFKSLLVANRGEIARRIFRTARRLGIHTIAVCSEGDRAMPFAQEADECHVLGADAPKDSYLSIPKIMEVALRSGAQAIHPGYGFLSENPAFARAVRSVGLTFVGPSAETMEKVGGKLAARALARAAGVPLIPGSEALPNLEQARVAAREIGYPVMIKASAGGGGIGMTVVQDESRLERGFEDARKKGSSFFGNDLVYLEKLVESPAHVEVQIFGDRFGTAVALGERDCTVQRRNQKVLEETPSPRIDSSLRADMLAAAVRIAKKSNYENAGTVEMMVSGSKQFYFLEVNSRLQVEHPVTEMVTGLDLVEWQLAVASGARLPSDWETLKPRGASIEVRICAEDPAKRFFPSPGTVDEVVFPDYPWARIDAGIIAGSVVSSSYDSLLGKLIVHGADRAQAMERLTAALQATKITGVRTNLALFPQILAHPVFKAGTHDTAFLSQHLGYK